MKSTIKNMKNMLLSIRLVTGIIILSFISSCIDQINYDVKSETTRLVINGLISSNFEKQTIQVRKSVLTGTGNLVNSTPVNNASVTISGNNSNFVFNFDKDGNYTSVFKAEPGKSYILEVKTDGRVYRSSSQIMPQVLSNLNASTDLISIQFINASGNVVNDKKVAVQISGNINNNFSALYRVLGKYEFMEFNPPSTTLKTCFVDDEIDNNTVKLVNANDLRTNDLEKFTLLSVPFDARFFRMYAFTVKQYSISQASLSYWKKVNQVTKAGDNLFDSPPGRILGNIRNINDSSEEVLGNFTLGAVSEQIVYTNMTRLGNVVNDPCQVRFNTARPSICLNCLLIPNSTTVRPANWPF